MPCLWVLIRHYCRRFIPPSLYSLLAQLKSRKIEFLALSSRVFGLLNVVFGLSNRGFGLLVLILDNFDENFVFFIEFLSKIRFFLLSEGNFCPKMVTFEGFLEQGYDLKSSFFTFEIEFLVKIEFLGS